jgi:hypothetical protein
VPMVCAEEQAIDRTSVLESITVIPKDLANE